MTAFTLGSIGPLTDREYFGFLLASLEAASRRIWASIFLYDLRPSRDLNGDVMELTTAMVQRRVAGVDVRLLVSGEVSTPDIAVANRATALFLDRYGVLTRHAFSTTPGRSGSHAKYAVIDDMAILGSQNWTDDAFRLNTEDAVVVTGQPVDALAALFQNTWYQARAVTQ